MIQGVFGEFLVKNYYGRGFSHVNSPSNERAAVIVETRSSFWLPLVIANFADKLPNWNIYLFLTLDVYNFLIPHLKTSRLKINIFDVTGRFGPQEYSCMLYQREFWNMIREDVVLIFQTDTVIFKEPDPSYYQYAFVGSPCGELSENFIMNGGLSLRSKRAMLHIVNSLSEFPKEPEDVYFTNKCRQLNMRVPDIRTCFKFAAESRAHKDVIGVHGTDKYYLPPCEIENILHQLKLVM
jgi:Protein of unknown function (DUF5672)